MSNSNKQNILNAGFLKVSFITLVLALSSGSALAEVKVLMKTSMGDIHLSLNDEKAPISVANFVAYVNDGYYDNTVFHRVISGFMIQGGGFTDKMKKKQTRAPIENESRNGLKNEYGTIAMARTANPDSATAQFFINQKNNKFLNENGAKPGYAVFGKVTQGIEVVEKIAAVPTGIRSGYQDVPLKTVLIQSVQIVSPESPVAKGKTGEVKAADADVKKEMKEAESKTVSEAKVPKVIKKKQ